MTIELPIKIGIVSDLHAEFWNADQFNTVGNKIKAALADVDLILLPGDIDNGLYSVRTARQLFPHSSICLVAGNHEFYQRDYDQTLLDLHDEAVEHGVHFLHMGCCETTIHGRTLRVLGTTLWTDFALQGPADLAMLYARRGLNDFRLIRHRDHIVTPADTLAWHAREKTWLLDTLRRPYNGLTIVMTHHAPVSFSVHPRYVTDRLSPCFASNLESDFVRDDLALVCWGHTHHSVDQMIDLTRFVSLQTGYVTGDDTVENNDFGIIISI